LFGDCSWFAAEVAAKEEKDCMRNLKKKLQSSIPKT